MFAIEAIKEMFTFFQVAGQRYFSEYAVLSSPRELKGEVAARFGGSKELFTAEEWFAAYAK